MRFEVVPMRLEHIPAVCAIERVSFSQTWPPNAYRKELTQNKMAYYFVLRRTDAPALTPAELGLELPSSDRAAGLLQRLSGLFRRAPTTDSVATLEEQCCIAGYAGLWLMVDEAHITTIATHPKFRGMGLGEQILLQLIDTALDIGARWLTLEVRATNTVAQALYAKYTFREMGVRKRYYSDNGEDALVMWTDPIDTPAFQHLVSELRAKNEERLAQYE